MKIENSLWTLESPIIISRMESLNASTATSMGIWPKNAKRRKRRKLENVSNVTKKDISQRTVKGSSQ